MRIIEEEQLDFDDLMLMPQHSDMNSRKEVILERTIKWIGNDGVMHSFDCIPIMAANMIGIGCPSIAKVLVRNKCICTMEKHYSFEELDKLYEEVKQREIEDGVLERTYTNLIFPTIGIKENLDTLKKLASIQYVNGIVLDVPNAYIPNVMIRLKELVELFPHAFISVGNIVTSDRAYTLLEAGATAVKVNVGAGSCCLTRQLTNCGRPQASAVVDCANAAHNLHKFIISDGGCKNEGHVVTAFALGADFVMTGSLFNGCDEMESEIVERNGKKYKIAMGSSSKRAQDKVFGGMSKYRASEGREVLVPCKGPLQNTLDSIFGGLRSAGTYIGSHELKDFNKHANFYKVRRTLNTLYSNCESVAS